jgi:hypothetical protein
VREAEHQHRVGDDEAEEEQDREVCVQHSPYFVKSFTKSSTGKLPANETTVNGVGCAESLTLLAFSSLVPSPRANEALNA